MLHGLPGGEGAVNYQEAARASSVGLAVREEWHGRHLVLFTVDVHGNAQRHHPRMPTQPAQPDEWRGRNDWEPFEESETE